MIVGKLIANRSRPGGLPLGSRLPAIVYFVSDKCHLILNKCHLLISKCHLFSNKCGIFGFFVYLCRHEEALVDIGNDDAAFGDEG